MNNKIHRIIILTTVTIGLALATVFNSCQDYFDFSQFSGIEASGEWGIPLINAQYSIEQILQQFNDNNLISVDENGILKLTYEISRDSVITGAEYLSFDDFSFEEQYSFDVIPVEIPNLSISYPFQVSCSLESDKVELELGQIKSGMLHFDFSNNIDQNYTLFLSTSQIQNANGDPFSITINSSNSNSLVQQIDLADYRIIPLSGNTINFDVQVILVSTGIPSSLSQYQFNCGMSINGLKFRSLMGKIAPITMDMNETIELNLFSSYFGGELTIHHPKIMLYTQNSFGVDGLITIDTAQFSGPTTSSPILVSTPVSIPIPISPNNYYAYQLEECSIVTLNTEYDMLKVSSSATINPQGFDAGTIMVNENSLINVKITAEIPIDISLPSVYYIDTLDINIPALENLDIIKSVQFRFLFTNSIPLNANAQLFFMDSLYNIQDSLFTTSTFIQAGYNNIPYVNTPIYVDIPTSKLMLLKDCKKLLFHLSLDSDQQEVIIRSSQFLKLEAGVKIKYDGEIIL